MRPPSTTQLDELRDVLLQLVEECPVLQCNPAQCPLYALRKLPADERLRWFKALNEEDLKYLAAYHFACAKVTLESTLADTQP